MYFTLNLKILRKLYGYTQEKLGEILTIKNSTVSNWEQGIANPDFDTLLTLAKIFHVSLDVFLKDDLSKITKEELKHKVGYFSSNSFPNADPNADLNADLNAKQFRKGKTSLVQEEMQDHIQEDPKSTDHLKTDTSSSNLYQLCIEKERIIRTQEFTIEALRKIIKIQEEKLSSGNVTFYPVKMAATEDSSSKKRKRSTESSG